MLRKTTNATVNAHGLSILRNTDRKSEIEADLSNNLQSIRA